MNSNNIRSQANRLKGALKSILKAFFALLAETFRQWIGHKVPKMGAALSYYTVLSLAPLASITLNLASLAIERNEARAEIVNNIRFVVGPEAADTVAMILTRSAQATGSTWTGVLGFAVLLFGASGVFAELHDSLNQIWDVTSASHPLWVLLRERIVSVAMLFGLSCLVLISFMGSTLIAMTGDYLHGVLPFLDVPWQLGNALLALPSTVFFFAIIFRSVPDVRIAWRDVWLGACIAAVLFVLGKIALSFYFRRTSIALSYGTAASVILILAWVYYSAQIMFFGAELTRVYALRYGSHRPAHPSRASLKPT